MRDISGLPHIDPPTANLIYGEMIDYVADTAEGTPVVKSWVQDLYYALIAVMDEADIVPNNSEEGATNSQFLDGLKKIMGNVRILEIDNTDHTVLDTENYNIYIFKNLTADHYLYLPTLADNHGRKILVINATGTYKVIVTPEGADYINDWNATVEITEKYGWWEFIGGSARWFTRTDGWSTIYEVSTNTSDTGLTQDGTWDDVAGMALALTCRGKGRLCARGLQGVEDTSIPAYLQAFWGLGLTSGNNTPDIDGAGSEVNFVGLNTQDLASFRITRDIPEFKYTVNSDITIYMKARALSDELNITTHFMSGTTNFPMYVRWRRIS